MIRRHKDALAESLQRNLAAVVAAETHIAELVTEVSAAAKRADAAEERTADLEIQLTKVSAAFPSARPL